MVSPVQFHESFTSDETAGMEIALRRDRGGEERISESWRHCEWSVESPTTDIAGLCIGSEPSSRGICGPLGRLSRSRSLFSDESTGDVQDLRS